MMDERKSRLSSIGSQGNSSNVELTKSNSHSNEVELDPLTGASKTSDYSRKMSERLQSDVEKLKDGSIHRHRYKLHESNENKTNVNQSSSSGDQGRLGSKNLSSISNDLASDGLSTRLSRLTTEPSSSSSKLHSSRLPSKSSSNATSSSRLRHLIDDEDEDEEALAIRRNRIRDYSPKGARLASELGIDVRSKPVSFNYEQSAKRRAHDILLREIDDEDEKFRTLPPTDPSRYRAREQMFANDWTERELRYLSKEGRQDLIRPTRPAVLPEQPFKHKRKSKYAKFVEQY